MMLAILILQAALLLAVAFLLLRRNPVGVSGEIAAKLGTQIEKLSESAVRTDTRVDGIRSELAEFRQQMPQMFSSEAKQSREEMAVSFSGLRSEILGTATLLGENTKQGLTQFRGESATAHTQLRTETEQRLDTLSQRVVEYGSDQSRRDIELRAVLDGKFEKLTAAQLEAQERLRNTVQERLDSLSKLNADKLEAMRQTVDEKLHATLESRLTESFGLVTEQLGNVQRGLGEMKDLATGVGDLKKIFANVKTRGGVAEVFVGNQLDEMLAPNQYVRNARIKPSSSETVEFAIKVPNGDGSYMLLPIDAKFPKEDWERLEDAYQRALPDQILSAGRAFESAIKQEGKRICEKYIDPPTTTPYAVMYLPTEGLYAEVVRRPGLLAELQSKCRITVAGPTTFMAILSNLQLVVHTVALQKKGEEVWKVLAGAKSEFDKFGNMIAKVEKQVSTVQNTLQDIGKKTRTINRSLKAVTSDDSHELPLLLENAAGILPALAAGDDDMSEELN